jgi:carboxypeptidase C (cathepsin A)
MKRIISIAVLLLLGTVHAAPKAERVQALPLCGPLPSAWYSGYLPVSDTKSLHYMYVESLSNPTTDPLVIWLNGGPGCSSLLGAFSENGPFIFDDGQSVIKPNEFSWNARANVLYIESPANIGFSIGGPNDWYFTDLTQSVDLFKAVQQFYVKFPELLPNNLWISGESYAGVYGPYLAWQIHNWNEAQFEGGQTYNLKGFAIGNGITDWHVDAAPATFQTYYEFNLIPPEIYVQFA